MKEKEVISTINHFYEKSCSQDLILAVILKQVPTKAVKLLTYICNPYTSITYVKIFKEGEMNDFVMAEYSK